MEVIFLDNKTVALNFVCSILDDRKIRIMNRVNQHTDDYIPFAASFLAAVATEIEEETGMRFDELMTFVTYLHDHGYVKKIRHRGKKRKDGVTFSAEYEWFDSLYQNKEKGRNKNEKQRDYPR